MQGKMETALSNCRPQITVQTLGGWEISLDGFQRPAEHTDCGSLFFRFPVTSPCGAVATLSVEIPESLQDEVRSAVGPRFPDDARFWLMLAEDALSNALEEEGGFPSDQTLRVERLTADQFDLALNWNRKG